MTPETIAALDAITAQLQELIQELDTLSTDQLEDELKGILEGLQEIK